MMKKILAAVAMVLSLATSALAQNGNQFPTGTPGQNVIGVVSMCLNNLNIAVPTNQSNNCPGGGGSSGAVFGPTAVGSPAANPPVLLGGTVDGTGTGAVSVWKVNAGIGFINCANCSGSGVSVGFGGVIGSVGTPNGYKDASGNFQPILGDITNGQWVSVKASVPLAVTGTFFQATQPISATSLPLPTGAATSALQTTGNNSLASILAALGGNLTVVQPTGTNLHVVCDSGCGGGGGGGLSVPFGGAIGANGTPVGFKDGSGNFQPLLGDVTNGQWVNVKGTLPAFASTPTVNIGTAPTFTVSGTVTANAGTNLNTSLLALESGGNLAQLVTDTGSPGATACTTDTASCNQNQQLQRIAQRLTSTITALGSPFQAGGSIGNTSFGISGTLPAFASTPTFNIGTAPTLTVTGTVTANLGTLNGAATAANQPTNAALGSTTSGQTGNLALGAVTTGSPTYTTGQTNVLSLTTAGALRVDATGTTQPVSGTVTANQGGTWNVNNISGTISLPTGAATAANQTNASQKTQIVDGSGNVITSTSNNLNVQCANCSGSGVSTGDEATFTAGTSLFAGSGGFFQTTPTSNPLTSGQQGMFQVTANRALFTNLRNSSGTEIATSANPLRVDPTGSTTQPVSGTVTAAQATAANLNATVVGTGTFAVQAAQSGSWNINNISGTVSLPTGASTSANQPSNAAIGSTTSGQTGNISMGAVTTGSPTYTTGQTDPLSLDTSGNLRVNCVTGCGGGSGGTSSNFGAAFPTSGTAIGLTNGTNMIAWSATSNYGTAPSAIAVPAVNAAVTNTVAISASSLPLPTGAATSANQPSNAAIGSTTSGQTGNLHLAAVTTAAPTYTTGQSDPLSLTTAGALRVDASGTTQPVSGTVTANQGGTWTNTVTQATAANLNATIVGTGTLAVQLTGATNNINNISGTISLPTGAATSANQPTNAAQGSTTSGQTGLLMLGAVTTASPTYTTAQSSALSLDTSGSLRVNCITGCTGGGGGGTSSNFGSAFPTAGTAIGLTNGTNMIAWSATSNYGTAPSAIAVPAVNAAVTNTISANPGTAANWGIGSSTQNSATVANGHLMLGQFNTSPTTITSGNMSPIQLDSAGNQLVNLKTAIPAGTNLIGKTGIDQTTPGTTNLVNGKNCDTTTATQCANVKAASTNAAATDLALVADPRPNSAATVSGASTNPSVTLTLPATTTAYSAGQLICTNATAATCNTGLSSFSFAIANSAGGAAIARLRLSVNDTTSTAWAGQTIQVDLWTSAPTFTNGDRGTWLPATGSAAHLASFSCAFPSPVWGDGLSAECAPIIGNGAGVKLGSGTAIFASLMALTGSGVTGASKVFTLVGEVIN